MGLEFALDELYATGWSSLDTSGCSHASDGRVYPRIERVRRELLQSGFELELTRVDQFDCYRAAWRGPDGEACSVVGHTEDEAAVFALAQHRRRYVAATV